MAELLLPLKPIPIKERLSVLYIEKGHLDVLDGAFVIVDKTGVRTHVPVGGIACLMLEPGTRVSHAAAPCAAVTTAAFASQNSPSTELRRHAQRPRSPAAHALTLVHPSAIVRASPFAPRHATRLVHSRHAAHRGLQTDRGCQLKNQLILI